MGECNESSLLRRKAVAAKAASIDLSEGGALRAEKKEIRDIQQKNKFLNARRFDSAPLTNKERAEAQVKASNGLVRNRLMIFWKYVKSPWLYVKLTGVWVVYGLFMAWLYGYYPTGEEGIPL